MRCVIPTCNNDSRSAATLGVTFHKFPVQPSRRAAWVAELSKDGWLLGGGAVCSDHFLASDVAIPIAGGRRKLRPSAVPAVRIRIKLESMTSSHEIHSQQQPFHLVTLYNQTDPHNDRIEHPMHSNRNIAHHIGNQEVMGDDAINISFNHNNIANTNLASSLPNDIDVLKDEDMPGEDMNSGSSHGGVYFPRLHEEFDIDNGNIGDDIMKEKMDNGENKTNVMPQLDIDAVKNEKDDLDKQNRDYVENTSSMGELHFHEEIDIDDVKIEDAEEDSSNYGSASIKNVPSDDVENFAGEEYSFGAGETNEKLEQAQSDIGNGKRNIYQSKDLIQETYRHLEPIQRLNSLTKKSSIENRFRCHVCNKVFSLKAYLQRHLKIHSGKKPHACSICSKAFYVRGDLLKHLRRHSGAKPYTCNYCKKAFKAKSDLVKHLRIHSGEKLFSCNQCDKSFIRNNDLQKHLIVHSNQRIYVCDICKKAFFVKGDLRNHLKSHSSEKPFICNICNKAFRWKGNLQNHLRIHSDDKPYSCNICKKAFRVKDHLGKHHRIHSGEKPYSCQFCKKTFRESTHLKKHYRKHSGEKPFSCSDCKKSFSDNSNLQSHKKRVHFGEKPYPCLVCKKVFSAKGDLANHMKRHSNEKSHLCLTCGKAFCVKSDLVRHFKIHSGEKPHSCYVCKKTFSTKNSLNIHLSGKKYLCDICKKEFCLKQHLRGHNKTHSII